MSVTVMKRGEWLAGERNFESTLLKSSGPRLRPILVSVKNYHLCLCDSVFLAVNGHNIRIKWY